MSADKKSLRPIRRSDSSVDWRRFASRRAGEVAEDPEDDHPGRSGLAEPVLDSLVANGFYPALSHKMTLDHGS